MEDISGSKTFLTLGGVIAAIGQDSYDLIIEVIFCLVCTRET